MSGHWVIYNSTVSDIFNQKDAFKNPDPLHQNKTKTPNDNYKPNYCMIYQENNQSSSRWTYYIKFHNRNKTLFSKKAFWLFTS